MNNDKLKIIFGFALTSVIWGSTWLVIKIGLTSITPFYGAAFRMGVAVLLMLLIIKIRKLPIPFDKKSVNVYIMAGLLSFSIPFALVYWGQQYIASGLASILFALFPFLVGAFSHFILPAERLNIFKVVGIILGFKGILIIFSEDLLIGGETNTLGMVAIVLSCIMQAFALVLIKKHAYHVNPFHLNITGMSIGGFIILIFALFLENFSEIKFDMVAIGSVLYLGIFGSVVTFTTYFWMLKRVEAVYLSLLAFVTPILAVILGAILLHERLSTQIFQGGSLVLFGIIISNGKDLLKSIYEKKSSGTN